MKKSIRLVLWCLLILLLAAAGIFAAAWFSSRKLPAQPEALKCRITPSHAELGGNVTAYCTFNLPLCRRIGELKISPAPGTLLTGKAGIRWKMTGLSTRQWQITIPLRAYRPGAIPAGKISFAIMPSRQDAPAFTTELPGFTAKESTAPSTLELAPESTGSQFNMLHLYWLLLLLIPAGIWLAYHLRKREKRREMTEWEKAVRDLSEIKEKFHAGSLAPEQAFVGLVELMRRYLEKRFSIPVTRRTAQEFLLILDRHQDKLPSDARPFLRNFIQEADMVKFARAVPEHASVIRSAESAGNFINTTRPESEVEHV